MVVICTVALVRLALSGSATVMLAGAKAKEMPEPVPEYAPAAMEAANPAEQKVEEKKPEETAIASGPAPAPPVVQRTTAIKKGGKHGKKGKHQHQPKDMPSLAGSTGPGPASFRAPQTEEGSVP